MLFKPNVKQLIISFIMLLTLFILGCDVEPEVLEPIADDGITANEVTKGDTLDTSTFSGDFIDPETGDVVEGTLSWVNPDQILDEDTKVEWRFIPDDDQYETITGSTTVNVIVEAISPTVEAPITTGEIKAGNALSEANPLGDFIDPETGDVVEGTLSWVNPDQILDEDTKVEWRFIPDDDQYETITGSTTVEIESMKEKFIKTDGFFYNEIVYTMYETDYSNNKALDAFHSNLAEDGYTSFEPDPGLESHFIEQSNARVDGQFYEDETYYLYIYEAGDMETAFVTAEVEKLIVEAWLSPDDLCPDEDYVDVEDFEFLPRYEGSQLTKARLKESGHPFSIFWSLSETFPWAGESLRYRIFESEASLEDINDYYKDIFSQVTTDGSGWIIKSDTWSKSRNTFYLVAEKEDIKVGVKARAIGDDFIRYELYTNTWTGDDGPIPETDDFPSLHRVERYPDSVGIYEKEGMNFVPGFAGRYGDWTETKYRESVYVVEAEVRDVYNYYSQKIMHYDAEWADDSYWAQEWSRSHFVWPDYRSLEFFTDNKYILIIITDASKYENAVTISFYIQDLVPLPEEDLYDRKDFPTLPRYPESVVHSGGYRLNDDSVKHGVGPSERLEYATSETFADVEAYYLNTLPEEGWSHLGMTTDELFTFGGTGEKIVHIFESEYYIAEITIERGRGYQDATMVRIHRIPSQYPLPDADLTGEDFDHVERYPGAIIFEEGFVDLESYHLLLYSIPADIEEVYNFYKAHFDEDWEVIDKKIWLNSGAMSSSHFTEFIIHVRKDAENVLIEGDTRSRYIDAISLTVHVYYESEGDLPDEDIMGEDFESIERYPDSVILLAEEGILVYGTVDSLDSVYDFYKTFLPEAGFTIVDDEKGDESFSIVAMIGMDTFVYIDATTESDYDDAVEITVLYSD